MRKKSQSFLIAVSLLLFAVAIGSAAELPLVYSDGFENGNSGELPFGWSKVNRGSSQDTPLLTSEAAHSGSQSLQVARHANSYRMSNGASIAFTALKERAVVTFWLRASDMERSLVLSLIGEEQGDSFFGPSAGPYMLLRNATLQAYDTSFRDLALYEPNRWHKVKVDINIKAGTYDVFFDDSPYAGNLQPLKFRNKNITNLASFAVSYHAAKDDGGYLPVYIDDLEVRGK